MNRELMASCFNEWMRRFTENPRGFQQEFETVGAFLRERAEGREPSYGEISTAYMAELATTIGKGRNP